MRMLSPFIYHLMDLFLLLKQLCFVYYKPVVFHLMYFFGFPLFFSNSWHQHQLAVHHLKSLAIVEDEERKSSIECTTPHFAKVYNKN